MLTGATGAINPVTLTFQLQPVAMTAQEDCKDENENVPIQHDIVSTTFYWLKEVTNQAQVEGVDNPLHFFHSF